MFYSITGKVTRVDENVIVVYAGGVGFEVVCSLGSIQDFEASNSDCVVYTYLQVRDDGISLFGFSSLEEKRMFLNLISVSGIGPKMAIGILSGMSARMLAGAVINKDISVLTKVKGLGKKTAERIVLELKEKVDANLKQPSDSMDGFPAIEADYDFTTEMMDAIAVLVELGIKKEEATKLVKSKATREDKADVIIRKCL